VEGTWKSIEKQAGESLECYRLSLMRNSDGNSEDQNAIGMKTAKMFS
jgi:hypothetical protein